MTWSKDRNPALFWPLTFLPLDPDICQARILSFGYNADFANAGNVCHVILDFAKKLLYDLKYCTDDQSKNLHVGKVRESCPRLRTVPNFYPGAFAVCCA